jgi:hypothetical protein
MFIQPVSDFHGFHTFIHEELEDMEKILFLSVRATH